MRSVLKWHNTGRILTEENILAINGSVIPNMIQMKQLYLLLELQLSRRNSKAVIDNPEMFTGLKIVELL